MEGTLYHVELAGRTVGPYDRRTIVGMRIKETLTGEHVVIGPTGARTTVADLIRTPGDFNPTRTSVSVVHATFTAGLVEADRGAPIPRFHGEMEARVQVDVLRLAGRFREGLRWKDGRVKIPLSDVVHTRVRGSVVDLWLRGERGPLRRVALELFSAQSASDLLRWLPDATPHPDAPGRSVARGEHLPIGILVAVLGVVLTVGLVLATLLLRRPF